MNGFRLNSMFIPDDLAVWLRENARHNKGHIGTTIIQKLRAMKQLEEQLKDFRKLHEESVQGSCTFAGITDLESKVIERENSFDLENSISLEDMERHFEN